VLVSEVGGGVILERERCRASSWCDLLVCDGERCGIIGVDAAEEVVEVEDRELLVEVLERVWDLK